MRKVVAEKSPPSWWARARGCFSFCFNRHVYISCVLFFAFSNHLTFTITLTLSGGRANEGPSRRASYTQAIWVTKEEWVTEDWVTEEEDWSTLKHPTESLDVRQARKRGGHQMPITSISSKSPEQRSLAPFPFLPSSTMTSYALLHPKSHSPRTQFRIS